MKVSRGYQSGYLRTIVILHTEILKTPPLKKRKVPFMCKVRMREERSYENRFSDVNQHDAVEDSSQCFFDHDDVDVSSKDFVDYNEGDDSSKHFVDHNEGDDSSKHFVDHNKGDDSTKNTVDDDGVSSKHFVDHNEGDDSSKHFVDHNEGDDSSKHFVDHDDVSSKHLVDHDGIDNFSKHFLDHDEVDDSFIVDHDHTYCLSPDTCNMDVISDMQHAEKPSFFPVARYLNPSAEQSDTKDMFHAIDSHSEKSCDYDLKAINENECYPCIDGDVFINTTYTIVPEVDEDDLMVDVIEDDLMTDVCKNDIMPAVCEDVKEVISKFQVLKSNLKDLISPYCFHPGSSPETIEIVEMYPTSDKSAVKLIVTIDQDFCAKVFVHRKEIPCDHDLWTGLPAKFDTTSVVLSLLSKLLSYSVCVGNFDEDFQNLAAIGSVLSHPDYTINTGYREGDFHAKCADTVYNSTIRSTKCQLLVLGLRCGRCSKLRTMIRSRRNRLKMKQQKRAQACDLPNFLSKNFKHCNMSEEDLIGKINQQKSVISDLEKTVEELGRQINEEGGIKDEDLDPTQNLEMKEM